MGRRIATLLAMAAAAVLVATTLAGAWERGASATLQNAAGEHIGAVRLSEDDGLVRVDARVRGLTPGMHGFHVHQVGTCTAPAFTSAGTHFDPAGGSHPAHAGDMPVLLVNEDGTGRAIFVTDRFSIEELFDGDGSAVIVHAGPDNYANIPSRYAPSGPDAATLGTGDAGARAACGRILAR